MYIYIYIARTDFGGIVMQRRETKIFIEAGKIPSKFAPFLDLMHTLRLSSIAEDDGGGHGGLFNGLPCK